MTYEEQLIPIQDKKVKKKVLGLGRRKSDHKRDQHRRQANMRRH